MTSRLHRQLHLTIGSAHPQSESDKIVRPVDYFCCELKEGSDVSVLDVLLLVDDRSEEIGTVMVQTMNEEGVVLPCTIAVLDNTPERITQASQYTDTILEGPLGDTF